MRIGYYVGNKIDFLYGIVFKVLSWISAMIFILGLLCIPIAVIKYLFFS